MRTKLALLLLGLSAFPTSGTAQVRQGQCGYDRWSVKTLTDADRAEVQFRPVVSTITALGAIPIPEIPYPDDGRIRPQEITVYRVRAVVRQILVQDDRDWHLILADPETGTTMVAEIPDPTCTQDSGHEAEFAAARDSLHALPRGAVIEVTGVGFFDYIHNQRGRAPNGFELHPVLLIKLLP